MLTNLIKLLPIEDAPYQLRIKFLSLLGANPFIQFGNPTPRLEVSHAEKIDWLHNGYDRYKGNTETAMSFVESR